MDQLPFIACDALVGWTRMNPDDQPASNVDDFLAEMVRLHIASAIVRHRACIESAPYYGNQMLMEEVIDHPELIPCWVLTPDGDAPDFNIKKTISRMVKAGVKTAWISPEEHLYSPKIWCSGLMYDALQEYRIPLFVDYNRLHPDDIHSVCSAFPRLRLVLLNVPRVGRNRMLYPLLGKHDHLYLCFNPLFSVHDGYMDLVKNFGIKRWVFGIGYPVSEGGAGIAGLMYSGLSEDALRAVAYENIERLLGKAGHKGDWDKK